MESKFKSILSGIKTLKIQGAENIAKTASESFRLIVRKSKAKTSQQLESELREAAKKLISTRPTEPAMRNSIKYILHGLEGDNVTELAKKVYKRIDEVTNHFEKGNKKIVEFGEKKIKNDFVVFTHCHSSSVVSTLIKAKKRGKKFQVNNTETRPLLQGRTTAKELSKENIPVNHYIDSAAMLALKKADICLFGADALQSDGRFINKIGTGLFSEIACTYNIPVFICVNSWKFDPITIFGNDEPIESRGKKEVWQNNSKNIEIHNPAFEIICPNKITGIISEFGVYSPAVFTELTLRYYPWMKDLNY